MKVSGWETLPPEHRAWLLAQWRRTGYGQSERLAAELGERLRADPECAELDPPSHTTVYRWARKQRRRAAEIRYTAELRAATVAALPEEDASAAERVGAYLENRVVEALEDLDALEGLDPRARVDAYTAAQLANTARRRVAVQQEQAELARVKWEAEQAARREAAQDLADRAASEGESVTPERLRAMVREIYGV